MKFTTIATNCLKTPLLRNVFLGCLVIITVYAVYSTFVLIPSYNEMLIENKVDEAIRTGNFLSTSIIKTSNFESENDISKNLAKEIDKLKTAFNLYKLKIFSSSGKIIFSSNQKEIGKINTNDYFHKFVAKGKTFTKIVKKDSKSLEGKLIASDVAEIYIPIMKGSRFKGAFEIYYDITRSKQMLDSLLIRSKTVLYTIASTLFIVTVIFLLKTSKALIERRLANEALQQAHDILEERVAEQTYEIQITQKTSIEALAVLAEYNDTDTGGHLHRIQQFVRILVIGLRDNSPYSKYLVYKFNYIDEIVLASLLHDIGKVAISTEILTKPGKLTDEEFEMMKAHTTIAGKMLEKANDVFRYHFKKDSYLALARDIARYHHEKWDGKGYPFGLKKEAIPLSARIVAVADVYDALTSERSYKKAWSHEDAVNEINKESGQHFDPIVVDTLLSNADKFREISQKIPNDLPHGADPSFSLGVQNPKEILILNQ